MIVVGVAVRDTEEDDRRSNSTERRLLIAFGFGSH
jgi:hypothetical protein